MDENIIAYLPEFRSDIGTKITIRNLLTHTHGIPNSELKSRYKPISTSEFIDEYCEKDLEFEPGAEFKYSNIVGYFCLEQFLRRFRVKHMKHFYLKEFLSQ